MNILFWLLALILLLPVSTVLLEFLSALFARRSDGSMAGERPQLVVLVPAHNEEAVINETIASIMPQLLEDDRLLVVADNCSDHTAAIAGKAGAEVIERSDSEHRGKGFALAFGIDALRHSPPTILIMVDADCLIGEGSIGTLARKAAFEDGPVQALYLMNVDEHSSLKLKVTGFAWVVKNYVRPMGLSAVGMPCPLMGSGMAFPWHAIEHADLANDEIVEDMKMGIELALIGYKASFCLDAMVMSSFPQTDFEAVTQRRRWEHGHISVILAYAPKLLLTGLRKRDIGLFALGLDLMVPPLALHSMLLLAGLIITGMAVLFGYSSGPFMALAVGCLLFLIAIIAAWHRFAREFIRFRELLAIPAYIFSKLSVYTSFIFSRESKWIRTGRGDAEE